MICGYAVMVPTRAQGLMRSSPTAEEVRPYLELGLERAGDDDSEALVLLLASLGYWEFGLAETLDDRTAEIGREAAKRGREIAKRLGRPDLELTTLDALSSGVERSRPVRIGRATRRRPTRGSSRGASTIRSR